MFDLTDASTLSEADKIKGLLIGGGILALGGVLEIYTTFMNRYRAYRAESWPRVPGIVIAHRMRRSLLLGAGRIVPAVTYSYSVGGETYEHDAVMFGGHAAVKRTEAEAVLRRYPLDATIEVIVDPKNPRMAALETTAMGGKGFTNGVTMAASGIFLLVLAALS